MARIKGKRIFVGVRISGGLKDSLLYWREEYEDLKKVTWVELEDLHMTVIPPWDGNSDEQVEKTVSNIRDFIKSASPDPIKVDFERVEPGPNMSEPRLIWLRGKPVEELNELKRDLTEYLRKGRQSRPLLPHVTLAKFKKRIPFSTLSNLTGDFEFSETVSSLAVYESRKPMGSGYNIIEEVSF